MTLWLGMTALFFITFTPWVCAGAPTKMTGRRCPAPSQSWTPGRPTPGIWAAPPSISDLCSRAVPHGYDTIDYRLVDRRLGTNEEFAAFVAACHQRGQKVIVDGVFNHVGRGFFAFEDLKAHREGSRYKDWFCDVNFWGNNEYNDASPMATGAATTCW